MSCEGLGIVFHTSGVPNSNPWSAGVGVGTGEILKEEGEGR